MSTPPITTVIGGLRLAAHALADKLGVTLVIGGSRACTDGQAIRLPDLPADSEEAALLARGYVDHEAAHLRFTDFSIPVRPWLNLLEDIRIEAEQGREFPGCAVNLRRLTAHLEQQGHFRGSGREPLSALMAWASCAGRTAVLKQPLAAVAAEMEALSRTLFGEAFCAAFAALLGEIGRCRSTADCDALARRIEHLIAHPPPAGPAGREEGQSPGSKPHEEAPHPRQDPEQGAGREPQPNGQRRATAAEGEPGVGPGAAPAAEAPAEREPQQSDASERGAAAEAEPAAHGPAERQRQNLARAAGADAEEAAGVADVGGILRRALSREHQQAQQQGRLEALPDTYRHRGSGAGLDPGQLEAALGIGQARRQTAWLRARLAGLLQARRRQPGAPRRCGQRLDHAGLCRLAARTPDSRLFRSRQLRLATDTAVLILADRSGSMSGSRLQTALRAAYVTAQALAPLPAVRCAVAFFPWAQQVALVKDFAEKLSPERFVLQAAGSTPMAEALLWAAMQLGPRPERRKLILALTDGQPDDVEATARAMQRLRAAGIETFGIGIEDSAILSWMGDGARVIRDCGELPLALVALLSEALLAPAARLS